MPACGVSLAVALSGFFLVWTWPVCVVLLLNFGAWSKARRGGQLGQVAAPALLLLFIAFVTLSAGLFVCSGLSYSLDPEGLRPIEHGLLQFQIGLKDFRPWSVWLFVCGLLTCLIVSVSYLGTRHGRTRLANHKLVVHTLIALIALTSLPVLCDIGLGVWTAEMIVRRYHVLVGQEETVLARYLAAESIRRGWTRLDKPDIRDVRQTFQSILEEDEKNAERVAWEHSRALLDIPPVVIFRDSERLPPPYPRKPPADMVAASSLRGAHDWQSFAAILAQQEYDTAYATARAHESLVAVSHVFSHIARQTLPGFEAVIRQGGLIDAYMSALVARYAELIFRPVVTRWRSDVEISTKDREERFRRLGVLFPSFNIAKQHLQAVWWKRGIVERELNLRDPSERSTEAGRMGRQIREQAAKKRRWIAEQERLWKIERARRWETSDLR